MNNKKSYADELLEQASSLPPRGQANRNIAQFLACKEGIEDALSKGWNMKAVWRLLYERKEFLGHYNCFTIYVKRFIRSETIVLKTECTTLQSTSEAVPVEMSQLRGTSASQPEILKFRHPKDFDSTSLLGD